MKTLLGYYDGRAMCLRVRGAALRVRVAFLFATAALGIGCCLWPSSAAAQVMVQRKMFAQPPGDDGEMQPKDAASDAGSLENDPEIERILHRATQARDDSRFDLAATLLQKVLDNPSALPIPRKPAPAVDPSDKFQLFYYGSIRDEAENLLSTMPTEGLHVYRLTADGEARGLLATPPGPQRDRALAEVVRRFFMSSVGDDAAYELGCNFLDRSEFVAASRLFGKILARHPDPSVPREQIMLRLAVAQAHGGDFKQADKTLAELNRSGGSRLPRGLLAAATEDIRQQATAVTQPSIANTSWLVAMGNAARDGIMPPLASNYLRGSLGELWSQSFQLPSQNPVAGENVISSAGRIVFIGGRGRVVRSTADTPSDIVKRWERGNWMPAGQMVFDGNHIWVKVYSKKLATEGNAAQELAVEQLVCYDAQTGAELCRTREDVHAPDMTLTTMRNLARQMGMVSTAENRPFGPDELAGFGDRVTKSFSVIDGVAYQLESARDADKAANDAEQQQAMMWNGNQVDPVRSNFLAAYKVYATKPASSGNDTSGKFLYERGADPIKDGQKLEVRFMSAPLACAGQLVVPVREGNSLWMYGLDPANKAATLWKTFLCDEPRNGCVPGITTGIAVDGGDIYVASGSGLVFAIEGGTGLIRWVTRYKRDAAPSSNVNQNQWTVAATRGMSIKGWDDDSLIVHGGLLVVAPSDADFLFALDRISGEMRWNTPRVSGRYLLGVLNERLYYAGTDAVHCLKVGGGLRLWDASLGTDVPSRGRGCLTADAIYMPAKDSIVKIDPKSGKRLVQVGVNPAQKSAEHEAPPVGNLFSNGERLYYVGPDRLVALENAKEIEMNTLPDSAKDKPDPDSKPAVEKSSAEKPAAEAAAAQPTSEERDPSFP